MVPASAPAPAAPSARVLQAVRTVWADLLGEAGDDAQFFEAGGDSILAMQMVSRLRREGFALALRDIYRHPVLADLAAHLGGADGTGQDGQDGPAGQGGTGSERPAPPPCPPGGPPRSPRSRPGSSGTSGPTCTSGTSRCCSN